MLFSSNSACEDSLRAYFAVRTCAFWDGFPSNGHCFFFSAIFFVLYVLVWFSLKRQELQYKTICAMAAGNIETISGQEFVTAIKGIRFGEADGNTTLTFDGINIDPPLVQLSKFVPGISLTSDGKETLVKISGINCDKIRDNCTVTFNERDIKKEDVEWKQTYLQVRIPKNEFTGLVETQVRVDITIEVSTQTAEPRYAIKLTCPKLPDATASTAPTPA